MRSDRGTERSRLLLTVSATVGVLGAHLLDAAGLLPGGHESAAARAIALAPAYDVATFGAAAGLAWFVDRLLRQGRAGWGLGTFLIGQVTLLGLPEVAAHLQAGAGTSAWSTLGIEVALQVVVAVAVIVAVAAVGTVLLRLPDGRPLGARLPSRSPARGPIVVLSARGVKGVRGRGPPVPVLP